MPVVIVSAVRSASDIPVTAPTTTSPSTMMMNRPKRSTIDSLGAKDSATSPNDVKPTTIDPTNQAAVNTSHTIIRESASRNALKPIMTTDSTIPDRYLNVIVLYSSES